MENESGQFDHEYLMAQAFSVLSEVYGLDMEFDEFVKIMDKTFAGRDQLTRS